MAAFARAGPARCLDRSRDPARQGHLRRLTRISQPAGPPPVGSDPTVDLPKIAGVTFEHRQGVILAMGEHLYDKKELLKAAGFQWDKTGKAWLKKAA